METELTKRMKTATHFYKPMMKTEKRTIRYADEVTTPTGIVDSIRFEDYIEKDNSSCSLEHCVKGIDGYGSHCSGCIYPKRSYQIGMCVTCFECKISLSDFKSKNGHNFHGNRNYYVVPKELISKIESLVPQQIGILQFTKERGLRLYRECEFVQISNDTKVSLLYDAMKKWCDGKQLWPGMKFITKREGFDDFI